MTHEIDGGFVALCALEIKLADRQTKKLKEHSVAPAPLMKKPNTEAMMATAPSPRPRGINKELFIHAPVFCDISQQFIISF